MSVILFINFLLNEKDLFTPDKVNPRTIAAPNIPEAAKRKDVGATAYYSVRLLVLPSVRFGKQQAIEV